MASFRGVGPRAARGRRRLAGRSLHHRGQLGAARGGCPLGRGADRAVADAPTEHGGTGRRHADRQPRCAPRRKQRHWRCDLASVDGLCRGDHGIGLSRYPRPAAAGASGRAGRVFGQRRSTGVPRTGLSDPATDGTACLARLLCRRHVDDDGLLEILDAATPGLGNKPAKETTLACRDALSSLWLLDAVPVGGRAHRPGRRAREARRMSASASAY